MSLCYGDLLYFWLDCETLLDLAWIGTCILQTTPLYLPTSTVITNLPGYLDELFLAWRPSTSISSLSGAMTY
jgi:hypothetical protein